ncbi:hypothetical protein QJS66_00440 [Kocuria rhizophila]|nr:hypothetical protein QJS66_00440 [Kocuria rhizophila]
MITYNTASAAVLRDARERYTRGYDIPVTEVIHRPCAAPWRRPHGRVGVMGAEAARRGTAPLRRHVRGGRPAGHRLGGVPEFVRIWWSAGSPSGRAAAHRPGVSAAPRGPVEGSPSCSLRALPAARRGDLLRRGGERQPGVLGGECAPGSAPQYRSLLTTAWRDPRWHPAASCLAWATTVSSEGLASGSWARRCCASATPRPWPRCPTAPLAIRPGSALVGRQKVATP